ncbi:MAG: HesA/MoeB/ThiF family protein [Deltaproteobacteria bacterium]|nr:HesA/MoeB/ThiF family protein [Deltaproteobacteria bacterium]MBW2016972.1 HesA/MoeB/ThiF family protein [Deltaproteobacteria bacterium]MBW2129373.1 HesA/MoeB/ThiF family protein [Deltaproteobacteria bacterium]MBW2303714.1 HesA/MoeB/ThiF family protein [Deltaproteobacteria bacterium]
MEKGNSKRRTEDIRRLLEERARGIIHPGGREIKVIGEQDALDIAEKCGLGIPGVFLAALEQRICPRRYIRNLESLSVKDQWILARSRAAVIGAGGLGGQVILILARIGVGNLVVADGDRFDETNLNRQALCTVEALGRFKSQVAEEVVQKVNPGVTVIPHQTRLDASTAPEILRGSDVVVDALDTISDRFILERAARELGIPLVHGAVAGFEGRLMTIFPEDSGMASLYGVEDGGEEGRTTPEALLGVPAPTPALLATLQAMETIKILLGRGPLMRNRMLYADLDGGSLETFSFDEENRDTRS